jgi:hypothetical protein
MFMLRQNLHRTLHKEHYTAAHSAQPIHRQSCTQHGRQPLTHTHTQPCPRLAPSRQQNTQDCTTVANLILLSHSSADRQNHRGCCQSWLCCCQAWSGSWLVRADGHEALDDAPTEGTHGCAKRAALTHVKRTVSCSRADAVAATSNVHKQVNCRALLTNPLHSAMPACHIQSCCQADL